MSFWDCVQRAMDDPDVAMICHWRALRLTGCFSTS